MMRNKIDYGIDLGTTNSAICRMEKGKPIIIKSDTLKDTMPSCVSVNKKGTIRVGDAAYNAMGSDKRRATKTWKSESSNTYLEFKRTMGTNTRYHSSYLNKEFSSEELSAEVLKTLKSFVTDENFHSVVITVPAKFTVNQKTATIEAAQMAGFKHCELLQEPIAASMAYGLNSEEKNGIWMVFDFGGGTFDAALLKVEDGIMQVFDTEGDNYLGGKNLDYAIVDELIIPYLMKNFTIENIIGNADKKKILRDAMKTYAEEAKNQLSFNDHYDILSNLGDLGQDDEGEDIELDPTITQQEAFEVMRPYFQKAVDICKNLIQRNSLSRQQISKLILVGGPTYCPLIREMLKEQITPNVDVSIDPMTAVATGAALYASTRDADNSDENIEVNTIKLDVGYDPTTVEVSEWVSVSLTQDSPLEKVIVELVREDQGWSSGKVEVDAKGNIIEVNLQESRPNSFNVIVYDDKGDRMTCFPSEITIIQGTKVGAAPLPYNIGIATWSETKECGVFQVAKGLEKNKPLPATGVVNDLKTTLPLRPGVITDVLTIPIYQVDDFTGAEGRPASLYQHVANVVITGDDVDELISENSLVDVTLKVDSSEQMKVEAHFLASDITVEKVLDTTEKHSIEEADKEIKKGIAEANRSIARLSEGNIPTGELAKKLDDVRTEYANNSENEMVLHHLKEVLRKIEDLDTTTEWQRLEDELREKFDRLEKVQQELGNEKSGQLVEQLRSQTDDIIHQKDVKMGREILEQIHRLFFTLTLVYQCAGLIRSCQQRFGSIGWKDSNRARQLVNQGIAAINNNPTGDTLLPIAQGLIQLMPPDEAANASGLLKKSV
jgi:molecular chaperone DnaK